MIYRVKTLILNGSACREGNTAALIKAVLADAKGEIINFNAFDGGFSACLNCGGCKSSGICGLGDKMSEVYALAESAQNVIVASPVYFGELTPPLLSVLSRFQRYFIGNYGEVPVIGKSKKGIIILTSGGSGVKGRAEADARLLLKMMNAEIVGVVTSMKTNTLAAKDDADALGKAAAAGKEMFK